MSSCSVYVPSTIPCTIVSPVPDFHTSVFPDADIASAPLPSSKLFAPNSTSRPSSVSPERVSTAPTTSVPPLSTLLMRTSILDDVTSAVTVVAVVVTVVCAFVVDVAAAVVMISSIISIASTSSSPSMLLTVILPSVTVNVMSVAFSYPSGAASS